MPLRESSGWWPCAGMGNLGAVYLARKDYTDAMPALRKALEINPAEAEKCLKQVIAQEKRGALSQAAHFQLAQAYRKLRRDVEAEHELSVFREM